MSRVDGKMEASITDAVTAGQKPEDRHIGAGMVTIHLEWFGSLEEARTSVLKVRAAQHTNMRRVTQCERTRS